ncbi:hypothetical protein SAMN06265173_101296 [Thalassovita litoralis]|uniref:DUF2125 domain-containing protein n=1 Tax=Thalassovita litoralis TaxID=1010611 RepID=A0A521APT3_9RHOB|nr:DUF2125 domain-containing protein [Thalassovita litoralis]SMO36781.1 hypothetical protein SAMN06265173_101296 [Thalassovita litoralis]
MKHWTALKTSAALAICMTGSAGFADVTASDVWTNWRDQMVQFGYQISADEAASGGVLALSNIKLHIDLPENEGTVDVTLDGMEFREAGDGTVQIMMPATMPVRIHVAPKDEKVVDATVNYDTQGLLAVASGSPDNLTFTYSADSAALVLAGLVVDGKAIDLGGPVQMTMTNISGSSTAQKGAVINAQQSFATGTLDYILDVNDPKGTGEHMFMKGSLKDLKGGGSSAMPEGAEMADLPAALKAGMSFDGNFTYAGGANQIEFKGKDEQFTANTSSTGGAIRVAMSAGQLIYDVMAQGSSVNLMGSDIPLPVSFDMAQAGFKLMMPLMSGDDLQDFQVSVTLGDFTMADMLWGIFDPTGQLPRDPATVAFDVTGQVKLTKDLLDEKQMAEIGAAAPGEIHAASINGLTVRAAGAELTGAGAFTFDNTDLTSFDGMPRPQGALNLKLVGGNGLLDKLVAMGFVPEDQAMGARMMMGLFAIPGEGEDTLNSTIEVNEQGHVLANGQRLK